MITRHTFLWLSFAVFTVYHARAAQGLQVQLSEFRRNCTSLCFPSQEDAEKFICLPRFVIAYSFKSGSSALMAYLDRHPSIDRLTNKELWQNGEQALQHFTFTAGSSVARPCASNFGLVWHPKEEDNLDIMARVIRVIMVIREPIDWSYSAYNYWCSHYHDQDCTTNLRQAHHRRSPALFEEAAFSKCAGNIESEPTPTCPLYFFNTSQACRSLIDTFGRQNVLLVNWNQLSDSTYDTMQRIARFLDLEPYPKNTKFGERFNSGPAVGREEFGKMQSAIKVEKLDPDRRNRLVDVFHVNVLRQELSQFCDFKTYW